MEENAFNECNFDKIEKKGEKKEGEWKNINKWVAIAKAQEIIRNKDTDKERVIKKELYYYFLTFSIFSIHKFFSIVLQW